MFDYVIYTLAGISILLAIRGFSYRGAKRTWVFTDSFISIVFSSLAIFYVSFWFWVIGFVLTWCFALFVFEPSDFEVASGSDDGNRNT